MKFSIVKRQNLEKDSGLPISKRTLSKLARNTGIPREFLRCELSFVAPACRLAQSCCNWVGTACPPSIINTYMVDINLFLQIHGPDSVRDFHYSMEWHGRPHQVVYLAYDERVPLDHNLGMLYSAAFVLAKG